MIGTKAFYDEEYLSKLILLILDIMDVLQPGGIDQEPDSADQVQVKNFSYVSENFNDN